jgi:cation:H+ antiporter
MAPLDFGYVAIGLVALFIGGDWLVKAAVNMALLARISTLIIGLTIVAVGTSTPELLVSVQAGLQGLSEISLGNVVGSNIANIGLILGLCGLIMPLKVNESMVRREIPMMIAVSVMAGVMMLDGQISRVDGILLVIGFVCFTALFYWLAQQERRNGNGQSEAEKPDDETEQKKKSKINVWAEVGRFAIGLVGLMLGANWLIMGATNIARGLQISELVIGMTIVAVGTSLPELVTSLNAAIKKENDIAIGNVVGSNIANLLLILGVTAILSPIPIKQSFLGVELLAMLVFAVLLVPFTRNRTLNRPEAMAFLGLYIGFVIYNFLNAQSVA